NSTIEPVRGASQVPPASAVLDGGAPELAPGVRRRTRPRGSGPRERPMRQAFQRRLVSPGVFHPWRSFPTMVASGLVIGFVTGGFPAYSREISQIALGLGMTFAMTEISFAGISPRQELRRFLGGLVLQTLLLIGLPMLVSRPLRRLPRVVAVRTSAVSVSFFFLVIAIAGSTRGPLLQRPELLVSLGLFSLARTFGIGAFAFLLGRTLRFPRDEQVALTAFASFKNLGLTVV